MGAYYQDDAVTIYHGDCREWIASVPDCFRVSTVLTDPFYGVGLGTKERSAKMSKHGNAGYSDYFEDTPESVAEIVLPMVGQLRMVADRVVLTPGSRCLFMYPEPDALWSIYYPNGAGIGRWKAFTCWQPILCYGNPPPILGCFPDTFVTTEQSEVNGHPCPKPLNLWKRILKRISIDGESVLDPFMGSGTTLRAAKDLGRKAIGIEIEERYCEIAAKRMSQEVFQWNQNAKDSDTTSQTTLGYASAERLIAENG